MIKKVLLTLCATISLCLFWQNQGYAQSNAGLLSAISNGPTGIESFFNTHAGNAAGLATLDPNLINQALSPINGGLANLTGALSNDQIGSFIENLSASSPLGAQLGSNLIGDIANTLPTSQATDILEELTSGTFGAIEAAVPGAINTLLDDIPNFDSLLNTGVAGDLTNFLSFASGGGGTFNLGPVGFTNNGGGSFTISAGGFSFTIGGSGSNPLTSLLGGGAPSLGSTLTGGSPGGVTEDAALPVSTPMNGICDADILQNMSIKAWLEAQREITQNANLITKPDSVLEYTCFDSFLNVWAEQTVNMFSENPGNWVSPIGVLITDTDMDNALTELSGTPLQEYVQNNFAHSFIGGRGSIDYTPVVPIAGAAYTCNQMDLIWQEAKCHNYSPRPYDGFLTYDQHASYEVRDIAGSCSVSPKYDPYLAALRNSTVSSDLEAELAAAGAIMQATTEPADCSANTASFIETGLIMFDTPGTPRPDAVCLRPGCFFDGTQCAAIP